MQANATPKAADGRRDFIVIPSDQVRVQPSDAEITDLLRAAARQHSEAEVRAALETQAASVPAVDATFRATATNDGVTSGRGSFGRRALRTLTALLLALGLGAAAMTWQTFGYAAKKALLSWAPKWAITASLGLGAGAESRPAEAPADAPPAPAAETAQNAADNGAPDNTAANAAAAPSDSAQQLQSMARDLASANQQIETLKASIAELKAGQQQMARDLAKASDKLAEQNAKAKVAAAPPHPPVHRPTPAYAPTSTYSPAAATSAPAPAYRPATSSYSAQAAVPAVSPQGTAPPNVPPPPMQIQPQADPGVVGAAPRPPMPVQ